MGSAFLAWGAVLRVVVGGVRQFFFVFLDWGIGLVLLVVIDFSNRVGSCQIFMRAVRALILMDVTVSYGWGKQVIVGDFLSG